MPLEEKDVLDTTGQDRGDVVKEELPPLEVELTDEDLAKIGRGPDKKEAAEPEKKEEKAEKKDEVVDKKPIMIPKARFDEANNKARDRIAALERANKELLDRVQANTVPADVKALEAELEEKNDAYGKLIVDGDLPEAKKVFTEISKLNRKLALAEATAIQTSHAQETRHVDALEQLVTTYKELFPVFDDAKAGVYNQTYVDYVAMLQGGLEAAGKSPAEALREAVEVAVTKFGLTGETEPEPEKKPDRAAERKTTALDKAVKAANAQPAAMNKVGADADKLGMTKVDVHGLSMDEFMKLPESTVKRLRGDIV